MNCGLAVLRKHVQLSGRARRAEFWKFVLLYALLYFLVDVVFSMVLVSHGVLGTAGALGWVYYLAVQLPLFPVSVRRLHDIGRSGWWLLVGVIPILGPIVVLAFAVQDGNPGDNAYGPDPKGAQHWMQPTDFGRGLGTALLYMIGGGAVTVMIRACADVSRPLPPGHYGMPIRLELYLLGTAVAVSTGLLGKALSTQHRRGEQAGRDQRARRLLFAARQHDAPDFSLYLRGFETTGRMPEPGDSLPLGVYDAEPAEEKRTDFETELAAAIENWAPLVALGRPGEQIGAGRIMTTEGEWRDDLAFLAAAATLVFLLPSPRAGTLWEVAWLREKGLLMKVVFVVPPKPRGLERAQSFDWQSTWPRVSAAMAAIGIEVPPQYDGKGLLFSVDPGGRIAVSTPLNGNYKARALGEVLKRHLGDRMKRAEPSRVASG